MFNMFKIFKKKQPKYTNIKLSDNAVEFIKSVIVPEMNITTPITNMTICKIEDWIYNLEDSQYDEEGNEIDLDNDTKEKIIKAQNLLNELMGIWDGDYTTEDLDDLNERLNLK